jgi:hypothetical protein
MALRIVRFMRLAVCVAILGEAPELRDDVSCLRTEPDAAKPGEEAPAAPGADPLPALSDTPIADPHAG